MGFSMVQNPQSTTPLGNLTSLYTDLYELTMAQGYFHADKHEQSSCFDYFFRSVPFDGGYVVFSGLDTLLGHIRDFEFPERACEYLKSSGLDDEFVDYLSELELEIDIDAPKEGEIVFPYEPVIRVQGPLLQAQILETLLLNVVNFESLIATKASRMRQSAGEDAKLIDFGLRRAQGYGGIKASRASVVGGFDSTSNVYAGLIDGLEISGTQAHSWIQSFDSELEAFRAYADSFPESTILLVDTYDTLESGVPNAIQVAKEMEERGDRLIGIRLDSGDLAYFAKEARQMLDEAGLEYVKIAASNQLDEDVIHSLNQQGAPIDVFGVGTRVATAYDCPALDGVYKLSEAGGEPRIKISESYRKVNFPSVKRVERLLDDKGQFYGDVVALADEEGVDHMYHPYEPGQDVDISDCRRESLLRPVVKDGSVETDISTAKEASDYRRRRLEQLPEGHKRFENPHIYKVGLSHQLHQLRQELIEQN
jgi:nicotinate phosphoribosyltransferase